MRFSAFALLQRLCVRVGDNKLDTIQLLFDHVVDRVTAGPADTKYGDAWLEVFLTGHGKVECHITVRLLFVCSRPPQADSSEIPSNITV